MIPKIIHQIWYQGKNNKPKSYPDFSHSWKMNHPYFQYILWDKNMIKNLLNGFPEYLKIYNELPEMIQKIDFAKYLILFEYGGIYADMDSESIQSIEHLLKNNHNLILAKMKLNLIEKFVAFKNINTVSLQNGFAASSKNHLFWKQCIKNIQQEPIKRSPFETHLGYIFRTSGPGIVTKTYEQYPNKNDIYVINNKLIDPVSWCEYQSNIDYKKIYSTVYAVHHYGSKSDKYSWSNNKEKYLAKELCKLQKPNNLFCIVISLFLILILIFKKASLAL